MSAPGMTSPIRAEAFRNLQLNAGIFLCDFDHSNITTSSGLKAAIASAITAGTGILGVTRGGGSFTVTRERRTPDVDGMRYAFKGADFIDSADAYLSGTLLEVNEDNWQRLIGTGDLDTTTATKHVLTMHTAVNPDTDYIEHLAWVGDIADGSLVMIELDNAFNTSDFNLTFSDKSEGTMTFEFHARQSDVMDYDTAPFRVIFFEADDNMGSITITSAAGTNVGGTKITTTNSLGAGESYVYKFDTNAPTIGYHEVPDYTWTAWDGSSDIAVGTTANGKKITVAVLNGSGKAVKSGNTTLAVKLT